MKYLAASFVLFAALIAASFAQAEERMLKALPNIEDMATLPGEDWVVASSMAAPKGWGALYVVGVRTNEIRKVYPIDEAAPRKVSPLRGACPSAYPPKLIKPHGIALQAGVKGALALYVVNHGPREAVEIFTVKEGAAPALGWTGCVALPKGATANSVAVAADGTIYVTATGGPMTNPDAKLGEVQGGVLAWTETQGWHELTDTRIGYPNGILVSPDGRALYVADWANKKLVALALDKSAPRRTLDLDFLPDNLRWDPDGSIWIGGQDKSEPVIACYTGSDSICVLPYSVARVDPQGLRKMCNQHLAPTPAFGAATVALPVGNDVWLGTLRAAGITIKRRAPPNRGDCVELD